MADHQNPPAAKAKAAGLLRPVEAAEYLAVSVRHLRDLTHDGKLPYVNVGLGEREARRYDFADLEAFIEDRKWQSANGLTGRPATTVLNPRALATRARLDAIAAKMRSEKKRQNSKRNEGQ